MQLSFYISRASGAVKVQAATPATRGDGQPRRAQQVRGGARGTRRTPTRITSRGRSAARPAGDVVARLVRGARRTGPSN
jgi:hypothetical protein